MINNNITRFFFAQKNNVCVKNYSGLIDAIYILFFGGDLESQNGFDFMLDVLRGLNKEGSESLVTELHSSYDREDEESEDLTGDCSHLSWMDSSGSMGKANNKAYALRVPINSGKSTFSCKSQGEAKGNTYLSELNVIFEGRSVQVSELQHALLHTPLKMGVLFRDSNGDSRLMVDPDWPMKIESSDESGEGPSGSASASVKFSQYSKIPPIYIRGKLKYGDLIGSAAAKGASHVLNCSIVPESDVIGPPPGND